MFSWPDEAHYLSQTYKKAYQAHVTLQLITNVIFNNNKEERLKETRKAFCKRHVTSQTEWWGRVSQEQEIKNIAGAGSTWSYFHTWYPYICWVTNHSTTGLSFVLNVLRCLASSTRSSATSSCLSVSVSDSACGARCSQAVYNAGPLLSDGRAFLGNLS